MENTRLCTKTLFFIVLFTLQEIKCEDHTEMTSENPLKNVLLQENIASTPNPTKVNEHLRVKRQYGPPYPGDYRRRPQPVVIIGGGLGFGGFGGQGFGGRGFGGRGFGGRGFGGRGFGGRGIGGVGGRGIGGLGGRGIGGGGRGGRG